jgi:regulator of cell morphogenesis and NO signaling
MIRSPLGTVPLGQLVQRDFRTGAILDRYRLDYCCGGAMTLAEGCQQRGIDLERVIADLESLNPSRRDDASEDPVTLIGHIISRHHAYVRESIPLIRQHLAKVVAAHGTRHAELALIESEFTKIANEMQQHLLKEEQVLFPYIASLVEAVNHEGPHPPDMFGTIQNPIRMMEIEHQEATDRMSVIRQLSHNYDAPPDGCHTYRLVLGELQAFDEDLRVHVDLEDNTLFPKAVELEEKAEMMARGLKSDQWERQASDR